MADHQYFMCMDVVITRTPLGHPTLLLIQEIIPEHVGIDTFKSTGLLEMADGDDRTKE